MAEELEKISLFQRWMADWMDSHPAAADLYEAKDIIPSVTIGIQYFLDTGDDSMSEFEFHEIMQNSEYVFKGGGWLVKS